MKTIAPTWLASPLRRLIQVACLALFLWLFAYICWPYTATPAKIWPGWLPIEVDIETGHAQVVTDAPPTDPIPTDAVLHVVDTSVQPPHDFGTFRVNDSTDEGLALEPVDKLSPGELDLLAMSFGPWSLQEQAPDAWPSHYADDILAKERMPAETFLMLDPLVSLSTALAARAWIISLTAAGAILLICLFIPRGFCGYVCPLGTLIDAFDFVLGRRVPWFRTKQRGWWVALKYYVLLATLVASLSGVLISGFVSAIPLVTRAMAYVYTPLMTGWTRGWHQMPPIETQHWFSIGLFLAVLGLGFFSPRFWCNYICPTGALFSLGNLFRLNQRKVESSCIDCNKCVEICPFDAIHTDFTTRTADCTFCQTCGGVCPTGAIKFVGRFESTNLKTPATVSNTRVAGVEQSEPPEGEAGAIAPRRNFLTILTGLVGATVSGWALASTVRQSSAAASGTKSPPVRPPGSVPEPEFLEMCIRCGECFQACPNDVLQPLGFEHGWNALWTPYARFDWSGCEASCNNCTQICPTGAIRAIPLDEKRVCRMGLAVVNESTCLPYAGREDCQLCVDECTAAGYDAIEFIRVGTEADALGNPIEDTGHVAPVVLPEKCVGCGLCQTRCLAINGTEKGLLTETAIRIEAGPGNEDRLIEGSYLKLREQEELDRQQQRPDLPTSESYLPDFLRE